MPFYQAKLTLCRFVTTKFSPLVQYAGKSNAAVTRADCTDRSMTGEPDRSMTGEPDRSMTGEPDRSMTGEPFALQTPNLVHWYILKSQLQLLIIRS
jgi:hypothetical protein